MKRKMDQKMTERDSPTEQQKSPGRTPDGARQAPDPRSTPARDNPPSSIDDDNAKRDRAGQPIEPAENPAKEIGGPRGPEPTRYGDWEVKGIVSDF